MTANMDGVGELEIAKSLSKFEMITTLTKQHDIKIIKGNISYNKLGTISEVNNIG